MKKLWFACLGFLTIVPPAWPGNGHLLHGVGAVNSSLGGVSTAVPFDVIGALHVNPALLTEFEGNRVGFSVELFADQPKATATFRDGNPLGLPAGSFTTEADTQPGVLPAIGFTHQLGDARRRTFGLGLIAVAGFRTDWPQDPANPIFAPQPFGFGTVKTNLAITKIPLAYAWKVNDRLSLGFSLAVYQGSLAISPLPPAVPQCTFPAAQNPLQVECFFSDADNTVTTYAYALQGGLYYESAGAFSFGLSYTTPQDFDTYQWSSAYALPYVRHPDGSLVGLNDGTFNDVDGDPLAPFGTHRTVEYALDGPAILSVGIGFQPGPWLRFGVDGRWVGYEDTDGAGGPGGFKADRSLNDIGWRDILIGAAGVEYCPAAYRDRPGPGGCALTLRGGFNYSQTPIRSEVAFTSLGTPPTFQEHYTLGVGIQVKEKIQVNVGAYYVPEKSVSGPLLSPFLVRNPLGSDTQAGLDEQKVEGGEFTISERILSGLVSLSYEF